MCMFMCLFFAKLFFYESATFINENSYALQVSVSPNLRKDIYTRKGLNPSQPKDSLQIFCFTIDQRITMKF